MDLNSVLIEGVVESTTKADETTGYWIDLKSKSRDWKTGKERSYRYQINIVNVKSYPLNGFQIDQRIRVVGQLQWSGRKGLTILAETIEKAVIPRSSHP